MTHIRTGIFILFLVGSLGLKGQDFPVSIPNYSYVKQEYNYLKYFGDSSKFDRVFDKMDSVLSLGMGKVNVVHFGGSHIQADILTSTVRENLQSLAKVKHPSRGFVFPFKAARTNNPGSYNISYTGTWDGCRNSVSSHHCDFGVSGITATAYDTTASIQVNLVNKYHPVYYFKSVKVFHEFGEDFYDLVVDTSVQYDFKVEDHYEGFTEYFFSEWQTEFSINLKQTDSLQRKFVLYGFLFETDEPDIVYHAIGVNGASVPSYLKCVKLEEQLKFLKPDLIVFSIGINDAYENDFTRWSYEQNYGELIEKIRNTCPDVAILFTTNNDSYKKRGRRRYLNRNGLLVQKSMQEMSKKYGAAYWDMFEIMGGLNSAPTWVANGKMKRDKIHFSADGYRLMGDLFFNALMQKYGSYIANKRN